MRLLLVDDEPAALERLAVLLAPIPDVQVVGTARNGREAAEAIALHKPDLVLLDIQMPERSGLAVAAALPPLERPEIVFVTAFELYATNAFEVEAADYLLKPVRIDRLRQALERARRRQAMRAPAPAEPPPALSPPPSPADDDADGFWVQVRTGFVRVPLCDIDWIEAAKDYVLLHTATRSHIHRATMNALERKLSPAELVRVHRSAFVRPSRVTEVQRLGKGLISLVLEDGVHVPVGPSYVNAVTERLALHQD